MSDRTRSRDGKSGGRRLKEWVTALVWLVVPFPAYLFVIVLVQPWLFEAVYGHPMNGPIPVNDISTVSIVVAFLVIIGVVVLGAYVLALSITMAKKSKPAERVSNGA